MYFINPLANPLNDHLGIHGTQFDTVKHFKYLGMHIDDHIDGNLCDLSLSQYIIYLDYIYFVRCIHVTMLHCIIFPYSMEELSKCTELSKEKTQGKKPNYITISPPQHIHTCTRNRRSKLYLFSTFLFTILNGY